MDRNILVDLFARRDKKRRRILHNFFAELITSDLSASYTAEMISKELGQPGLINAVDVTYCRFYYKGSPVKKHAALPVPMSAPTVGTETVLPNAPLVNMSWSDPNKISTQEHVLVKSKFSKKQ